MKNQEKHSSTHLSILQTPTNTIHYEKRLRPRLILSNMQIKINNYILSIFDISETGFSIFYQSDQYTLLAPGQIFKAELKFKENKWPIEGQVVRIAQNKIGCIFTENSSSFIQNFAKLINPKTVGENFRLLPAKDFYWLNYSSISDLILTNWANEKYNSATLYYLNHYINWAAESKLLTTGLIQQTGQIQPTMNLLLWDDYYLIEDNKPNQELILIARKIISNCKILDKKCFQFYFS